MSKYSGKFVLSVPDTLHEQLTKKAIQSSMSLNNICIELLQHALKKKEDKWWRQIAKNYISYLKKEFGKDLQALIIFGSYAQGTATNASDLDLLIVLDKSIPIRRSLYTLWNEKMPQDAGLEVTPQFVHIPKSIEQTGSLWFEVALSSEIVWEKNKKTSQMLTKILAWIAADKVRRHWSNGQPYWVRRTNEKPRSS